MPPAIETRALRKVYPASGRRPPAPAGPPGAPPGPRPTGDVVALDALDLTVQRGEFFGLLGPNGAGKTTAIGILTTRVLPTGGAAYVAGHDVVRESAAVRQRIGVVPQRANADRALDVTENLVFHAAYFGIPMADAARRAAALLDELDIADKAHAKVDALSGGQQQRVMVARALMHDPEVIFLDEPTVGLDPQARRSLWELLQRLHADGRTIVMTTHYMEEADRLCERLAIVDQGRLLACDTPDALKAQAPEGTLVELTLDAPAQPLVAHVATLPGVQHADAAGPVLRASGARSAELVPALLGAAEAAGRDVRDVHLARPSLETLFISLTGRKLSA